MSSWQFRRAALRSPMNAPLLSACSSSSRDIRDGSPSRDRLGGCGRVARDRHAARADKRTLLATAALGLVCAEASATPQGRGLFECPCTKNCSLHGSCHLCVAYHARKHAQPRCER